MVFYFDTTFKRSLQRYQSVEIIEIKRKLDAFIRIYDTGKIPGGFGLKHIRKNLWEIRINLPQRILFWKHTGEITFTFIGHHNEIRQFIKHI